MKKVISVALSLLFILTLFAGCGKEVKVTEENVKELFIPTLEAGFYIYGSAFYNVEKNEKGQPVTYSDIDGTENSYCKIKEKTTIDELIKQIKKYDTSFYDGSMKESVIEKDGSLYVSPLGLFGGYEPIYDLNSIKLEKTEGDIYYITVDEYAYPDTEADPSAIPGVPNFVSKITYKVKSVDGILQTQDAEYWLKESSPVNKVDDCEFIGMYDKFYGDVIERDGQLY